MRFLSHRRHLRRGSECLGGRAARERAASYQAVEVVTARERGARLDGVGTALADEGRREEHRHAAVLARNGDTQHMTAVGGAYGVDRALAARSAGIVCVIVFE